MTDYLKAKNYFLYLEGLGIKEAKKTNKLYRKILKSHGSFIAARFILEVYKELTQRLEKVKDGKKEK